MCQVKDIVKMYIKLGCYSSHQVTVTTLSLLQGYRRPRYEYLCLSVVCYGDKTNGERVSESDCSGGGGGGVIHDYTQVVHMYVGSAHLLNVI